jgi:hypothetical protein
MTSIGRGAAVGDDDTLDALIADVGIGIDTLWGGNVLHPSGKGRAVADTWFSTRPLPAFHGHPAAVALRQAGGVLFARASTEAIDAFLRESRLAQRLDHLATTVHHMPGLRGRFLRHLAEVLTVTWDIAQELLGRGTAVPYERSLKAATRRLPAPSNFSPIAERLGTALARAGYAPNGPQDLAATVARWREDRLVPMRSVDSLAPWLITRLAELTQRHVMPWLPAWMGSVDLHNVEIRPLDNAAFSGSLNYIGRQRRPDGTPHYEATYEINTSLAMAVPELVHFLSHEIVPGHVATYALLQSLHERQLAGFEATLLTLGTPHSALAEGIANNALLIAHGVCEAEQLPDHDLAIAMLLSDLQDEAKHHASRAVWLEGRPWKDVQTELERQGLPAVTARNIAARLVRHPLIGRLYLPVYKAGAEKVAALRRAVPSHVALPALFGVHGLVDVESIDDVVDAWAGLAPASPRAGGGCA